ncbi:MAG: DUF5668 domain-containing protein [Bacteroidota bacterium]
MKRNKCKVERTPQMEQSHFRAKLLGGLFVIGFGVIILMKQIGFPIPHVFTSWEIVLILIGLVSLVKHNFKKTFAYVLIVVGGLFMVNDLYPYTIQTRFIWPVLIIIFGISIFIKALTRKGKKDETFTILTEENTQTPDGNDYVESKALFAGVTKNIVSKNFKGAKITCVFGGTEFNLTHADFENQAIIDLTTVFGGVNLIIPSNWKVQTEITTAFGGVDDKRQLSMIQEDENKLLILRGNCVFGGVEISSYA